MQESFTLTCDDASNKKVDKKKIKNVVLSRIINYKRK